jgi:hypothetical protein
MSFAGADIPENIPGSQIIIITFAIKDLAQSQHHGLSLLAGSFHGSFLTSCKNLFCKIA